MSKTTFQDIKPVLVEVRVRNGANTDKCPVCDRWLIDSNCECIEVK